MDHTHPRRSFLTRFAAGVAAFTAAPRASALTLDTPVDVQGISPDAFLAKLTAPHRQYFDATKVDDGFPMIYAFTWARTMRESFNLGPRDAQAVIGLRHAAIAPGLNDQMWAKYKLGEFFKLNDPKTGKPAVRNYFNNSGPGDMMIPEANISAMLAAGHVVVLCNVALSVLSGATAQAAGLNMPAADAYKEWIANLVPGAQPVVSGVLAVHRAQVQGKCTYCSAA
jgi:hypothetical protein